MIITKADRMRKNRKKQQIRNIFMLLIILILLIVIIFLVRLILKKTGFRLSRSEEELYISNNGISRTGEPIGTPTRIIVRRSSVTGLKAMEMRNRYEGADLMNDFYDDKVTDGVHYVIGTDGQSILIVPLTEAAPGNPEKIMIEYCAENDSSVSDAVVNEVNRLLVELKKQFSLTNSDIVSE